MGRRPFVSEEVDEEDNESESVPEDGLLGAAPPEYMKLVYCFRAYPHLPVLHLDFPGVDLLVEVEEGLPR